MHNVHEKNPKKSAGRGNDLISSKLYRRQEENFINLQHAEVLPL